MEMRCPLVVGSLLAPTVLACDRGMPEALRRLDETGLRESMRGIVSRDQIEGLLGRRAAIVAHFDALIGETGAAGGILVLFNLPPRDGAPR